MQYKSCLSENHHQCWIGYSEDNNEYEMSKALQTQYPFHTNRRPAKISLSVIDGMTNMIRQYNWKLVSKLCAMELSWYAIEQNAHKSVAQRTAASHYTADQWSVMAWPYNFFFYKAKCFGLTISLKKTELCTNDLCCLVYLITSSQEKWRANISWPTSS